MRFENAVCIVWFLFAARLFAAERPTLERPEKILAAPAEHVAHALAWDEIEKKHEARSNERTAEFTFTVKNISDHTVKILAVHPSCGCTVMKMPSVPWSLAPGASDSMTATVDFAGKQGRFSKGIRVESTAGGQTLRVIVHIPAMDEAARVRNQQLALADRQKVFKGECASCHSAPIADKKGAALFNVACAICHESPHRAEMVPDLQIAREPRDAGFWRKWITEGREQSLMPAFAREHGGPLTAEQIESLVEFTLKWQQPKQETPAAKKG